MISTTKIPSHYFLIIIGLIALSQLACSIGIIGEKKSRHNYNQDFFHSDQNDRLKDEVNIAPDESSDIPMRYVTFAPQSSGLSTQTLESIRLISIYKENHPDSDVIITSTSQKQAQSNAHRVKILIEKFGIQSNHVKTLVNDDYRFVTDTTLLINVVDNQPKNYKYISAIN